MKVEYNKRGWYMTLRTARNTVVTKYGKTLEDLRWDISAAITCYNSALEYGQRPFRYTLKYVGKLV